MRVMRALEDVSFLRLHDCGLYYNPPWQRVLAPRDIRRDWAPLRGSHTQMNSMTLRRSHLMTRGDSQASGSKWNATGTVR
jgi:hypothetical protein